MNLERLIGYISGRRKKDEESQEKIRERVCTKGFYEHGIVIDGLEIKRHDPYRQDPIVIKVGTFRLIDTINNRYSRFDLNGPDWSQNEDEKLSKLIEIINRDSDIAKLNTLHPLRDIIVLSAGYTDMYCSGVDSPGITIVYDKNGLQIDEENGPIFPFNLINLRRYNVPSMNAERLKKAIVVMTERRNYLVKRGAVQMYR